MQKQTLNQRSQRHCAISHAENPFGVRQRKGALLLLAGTLLTAPILALAADELDIERANWSSDRGKLTVRGDHVPDYATVTIRYGEKDQNGAVIGTTRADDDGNWKFSIKNPNPVPCEVTAQAAGRQDDDKEVRRAPNNCSNTGGGGTPNVAPTANANGPYAGSTGVAVSFSSAGSSDPDGSITGHTWNFGDGGSSTATNPNHSYTAAGTYTVTLTVTDNDAATGMNTTTATISDTVANCTPVTDGLSINSTSQTGCPDQLVPESATVLNSNYRVLAINDLGMHCGDLDTRISSILPPFQVLLGQVIQRGSTPKLNPAGVTLEYSAASNPNDPILAMKPAVVQRGLMADGSTYKTNFWDAVAGGAYDPFYPGGLGITPLASGGFPDTLDV